MIQPILGIVVIAAGCILLMLEGAKNAKNQPKGTGLTKQYFSYMLPGLVGGGNKGRVVIGLLLVVAGLAILIIR